MKPRVIGLLAGIAWGAVGISSAAPADAYLLTAFWEGGNYATANPIYSSISNSSCGYHWNYHQYVKLISTSCNQNQCAGADSHSVTSVYSSGRKVATKVTPCGANNIYALGSCAC